MKTLMRRLPHWGYLSWAKDRFGTAFGLTTYPKALLGLPIAVPTKVCGNVYLRAGTADLTVYDEVFGMRKYDIGVQFPKFIIDAGAHIGLAAIFLSSKYPDAKIVAVEPDTGNFRALQMNVRRFPNISAIHAGLWSHETTLKISNPSADTWSFRVSEGGGIRAVTIGSILSAFDAPGVDLLKLDIEGSEKEVLEHSGSWMDRVGALVIELHDRHVSGCTEALEKAVHGHQFRRSMSGESIVLVKMLPITQVRPRLNT